MASEVRGRDEAAAPDDEIAVAIAVRCGTEVRRGVAHHEIVQRPGVDEIGIGMMMPEILERRAIMHAARREAQPLLENLVRIGPGHRAHRIEGERETARNGRADCIESNSVSISAA